MPVSQINQNSLATGVPSASNITTGTLPKAQMPSGTVLQVVSATFLPPVSTTSSSFVATGLAATITPISTSSRIAAFLSTTLDTQAANVQAAVTLFRDSTNLEIDGITSQYAPTVRLNSSSSFVWVDSPATTSATTYSVRYASTNASGVIFFNQGTGIGNSTSTLILMEIA